MRYFILAFLISGMLYPITGAAQEENKPDKAEKLVVLWTSDDPYLAERMVFMYTHAAKKQGWFDQVTIIVWGPSAKLTAENMAIQEKLKAMQQDGVKVQACIACASDYGVVEKLKDLGIEVKGMGKPLTKYLKSDAHVLTF